MLSLLIATENTHHFEILAANKKIMLLEFCEDQIDRGLYCFHHPSLRCNHFNFLKFMG